jgi:hypothetical protein
MAAQLFAHHCEKSKSMKNVELAASLGGMVDEKSPFHSKPLNDRNGWITSTEDQAAVDDAVPSLSTRVSLSGMVNSVKPHSKHIASFGNVHTMGLSRPLSPGKWIATSDVKLRWLCD